MTRRETIAVAAGFLVVAAVALLPSGCNAPLVVGETEKDVYYQHSIRIWHSKERGVTCFIYPGYGISCLPDASVRWP